MKDSYDVVIVGGAAIGASVAFYLAANADFRGSILIVERDPTFARASTSLSAASIRTQFSNPLNVKISQYGFDVISNFDELTGGGDLGVSENGYLFLAANEAQASILRENHEAQIECGADVVLWSRDQVAEAFPHLRVNDILLASFGRSGEGWFSNTGLMDGFRKAARNLGADFTADEVVGMKRDGARIEGVELASGVSVAAGFVVNAAGPRAALAARMAGLDVPVEPRKRTLFLFDCAEHPDPDGRLPLMIDPSGIHVRPEGRGFLTGCAPPDDPAVGWDDFEPHHDLFDDVIWPVLAHRSPAFEAVRVKGVWAGHYAYNTLDQNMIVGPHPEVRNFIFANGFSGHGLQQAPAVGRAISELIVYCGYRTLDLSEAGYERVIEGRPFPERSII